MKIALLSQPIDIFSSELETYLQNNSLEYKKYSVGIHLDLPVPIAEYLFSNVKGTPMVYVDGRYIADFIGFYENHCMEVNEEESKGWEKPRISDTIAVITVPDCRGCKETKEYLEEKEVLYKDIRIYDDIGPNAKFIKDFFGTADEKLNFPYVIINGERRDDWKDYIESEDFKA